MSDDRIADLKQFITATVRQEMSGLATKVDLITLDDKLSAKIDNLDSKLDTVQESIAQILDITNDDVDKRLRGLETRVGRLEHKAA